MIAVRANELSNARRKHGKDLHDDLLSGTPNRPPVDEELDCEWITHNYRWLKAKIAGRPYEKSQKKPFLNVIRPTETIFWYVVIYYFIGLNWFCTFGSEKHNLRDGAYFLTVSCPPY